MNNSIYKKGLAVVLIIALIIMALVGIKLSSKEKDIAFSNTDIQKKSDTNKLSLNNDTENSKENNIIIVDIDGAVNNPGVYEFIDGDRVIDAINKAGGLTDSAYTKNINKARKLSDGEKIYISEQGENLTDNLNLPTGYISDKININTATKEQLMTLDGIGEVYSQRIIDYREKAKFTTIDEIKNIQGIGEKTYEKIKEEITVE